MKLWENFTCIIFVKRNPIDHEDFIRFIHILECSCCSDIGKIGDRQVVGLTDCGDVGGIAHELGHVIHGPIVICMLKSKKIISDNYLELLTGSPFEKLSPDMFDTLDKPYDFDSIMHDQTAGTKKWHCFENGSA